MSVTAGLAIGSAIAGLGQGLYNTLSSAHQNEKNRQFALQQQRLQNQFNFDMWNRQNAYNSPSSQVQRLMQAGLNPNLAYSQLGSGEAGSLQSADANYKGEAPQSNIDFQGSVQSIINTQRADELHSLGVENQVLKNEYQTLLNARQRHDNERAGVLDDYEDEKHQNDMNILRQEYSNLVTQGNVLNENYKTASEEAKQSAVKTFIADATKDFEISLVKLDVDIKGQEYENLKAVYTLTKEKIAGVRLDNSIKSVQYEIMKATKDSEIQATNSANRFKSYFNDLNYIKEKQIADFLGIDPDNLHYYVTYDKNKGYISKIQMTQDGVNWLRKEVKRLTKDNSMVGRAAELLMFMETFSGIQGLK